MGLACDAADDDGDDDDDDGFGPQHNHVKEETCGMRLCSICRARAILAHVLWLVMGNYCLLFFIPDLLQSFETSRQDVYFRTFVAIMATRLGSTIPRPMDACFWHSQFVRLFLSLVCRLIWVRCSLS